jgi:AsmA protein
MKLRKAGMKPRQLPWKWLLIGLLVLLIAGAVVIPRQIGSSSDLRDRIAAVLSSWTGGTITLTEPLRIRYIPPLSLQGGFILTEATKLPAISSIAASDVEISLDLPELLLGRIAIDAIRLDKPIITLKETGAAAAEESLAAHALIDPPIGAVRVRDGTIRTASGAPVVEKLGVSLDPKGRNGALAALGSFRYRGERVAFAIDSGKISGREDAAKAPVTFKVTTDAATARFSGNVRTEDGLQADGELEAEMSDARHALNWLGLSLPKGDSLHNVTASGSAHWSGATLTIEQGSFSLDGNEAVGLLAFTMDERPRIEGTLDFDRLVLDPYLGASASREPGGGLFDTVLLKYLDADLRLSAAEIAASTLELGHGGLTITAKDGTISTEIGELELCAGQVMGRVVLNLSGKRPEASLAGSLSDVSAAACLAAFDVEIPVKGTGTLKLDVSTGGVTRDELIRGLVGKFAVAARDGVVPIDFATVTTGGGASEQGWSADAVTAFETLDADCRLSAGHVWCQSFDMQTSQGKVSGSGSVDVGQQTIDWDLSIVNPVASLNASQLVMPPRVTIRGPLTQPEVRGADRSASKGVMTQPSPSNGSSAPNTQEQSQQQPAD